MHLHAVWRSPIIGVTAGHNHRGGDHGARHATAALIVWRGDRRHRRPTDRRGRVSRRRARARRPLGPALPASIAHRCRADRVQPSASARSRRPSAPSPVRRATLPEISNLSNVDTEDRLIPAGDKRNLFNAGNQMWHSDSSFKRVPAHGVAPVGARGAAEGGETQFASMRVGYERLPEAMKRVSRARSPSTASSTRAGSWATSSCRPTTRRRCRPCPRPWCGPTHRTGARRSTWAPTPARSSACRPARRARCCASYSIAATRPELVYTHRWPPGDLVMWDNRCRCTAAGRGTRAEYRRVMHRTTVAGAAPTAADVPDVTVPAAARPDVAWGRAQLEVV